MATSGTTLFTVNEYQIVRQAMLNIGVLDGDEAPTAQETNDIVFVLNMMIKQWQGKADFAPGLKTWKRQRGYLYLQYNSGQYTLGPGGVGWTNSFNNIVTSAPALQGATAITVSSIAGISVGDNVGVQLSTGGLQWTTVAAPLAGNTVNLSAALLALVKSGAEVYTYTTAGSQPVSIEAAILRDNNGNDIPLRFLEQPEYDNLPNKTAPNQQADPIAIYHEFHRVNSYLFTDVWGSPDPSKYIVLTYLAAAETMTTALDELEYPQEWFLPVCWGLSKHIAPMFHVDFTPQMQDAYATTLAIAQRKEPEMSRLYFQPGEDGL